MLKNLCKDFLNKGLLICKEIESKKPLNKRKFTEFKFKNDLFNNEYEFLKKDHSEFFSRFEVLEKLKENDEFKTLAVFLSERPNIKKYYSDPNYQVVNLIIYLIENYYTQNKNFEFDGKKVDIIIKEFTTFVNEKILKINYFTPIYNFKSNIIPKKFDNVLLRKISHDEFKTIKEDLVGPYSKTPTQLYALGYVLETNIPFQNNPQEEENIAKNIFSKFLKGSLIFQPGNLQTGKYYRNFTKWTRNSSKISGEDSFHYESNFYKISTKKAVSLKTFLDKFSKIDFISNDYKFLNFAIDKFQQNTLRKNIGEKIVDLNISLECMFSSRGDTTLKLTQRISAMLTDDDEKMEEFWNFMKSEYKIRSDIVHGRPNESINEIHSKLELITRDLIKKFLNLAKNYSDEQFLTESVEPKKKSKKQSKKEFRKVILDELDIGIINRIKLKKLLEKTSGPFGTF